MVYVDPTAGWIKTPGGIGRFVSFDPARKTVAVEMDYMYLVEYDAAECYLCEEVNFFAIVGIELSVPIVGVVLSGLLVSRGANFVHDLLEAVSQLKSPYETGV